MEVPGRKLQADASAVDTTYCQPCAQDGETIPAEKTTMMLTSVYVDLTKLPFTRVADISVKSPTDNRDCWLTSMLLLPGNRLLLTDCNWFNSKVKLVDLQTSSMVSKVDMAGQPWAMCLLPGDRVAVTMTSSGSGIQFLETRGQLTLGNHIKVDGYCRGIAYHEDQLIVSYNYGELEVLNMNGNVIRKMEKGSRSQQVFECPFYLTVVREESSSFIYVSDNVKHTITKLDLNLLILQTFHNPALKAQRGITAVGNQLIICGYNSNNIMRLDLSSGQMTQLLGEKDGIQRPWYACYCPQQGKLFVTGGTNAGSAAFNNSVHVYTTSK